MKCLMKFNWVKLNRSHIPQGKGLMRSWARLASRAAFRKGQAEYCGHINSVNAGEWSGGIVGIKSILGAKNRSEALKTLDMLSEHGYITYTLDERTKKLTYKICDWVENAQVQTVWMEMYIPHKDMASSAFPAI